MVERSVIEQYRSYYGDPDLGEWRRLGAVDKANNICEMLAGRAVTSVVDIGCGDGAIVARLAQMKFASRYCGVDISESAVSIARGRGIPEAGFSVFDGDTLPFEDAQFDVAVLSHVVEHLEHPRVLLREARRVARQIVVEVPCEHTIRMPANYSASPVGHINFYTPATIRRLLQTCGLVVDKQVTRGCSLDVMRFESPRFGTVKFAVREAALRIAPGAAPALFVYHTVLLCH